MRFFSESLPNTFYILGTCWLTEPTQFGNFAINFYIVNHKINFKSIPLFSNFSNIHSSMLNTIEINFNKARAQVMSLSITQFSHKLPGRVKFGLLEEQEMLLTSDLGSQDPHFVS